MPIPFSNPNVEPRMSRREILVLFAHPALQKSRINRRLVQEPLTTEGVTLHDLYEAYPQFDIDVKREQDLLSRHEVVIFHHPFYWYSTPAILKEWQDLVLVHGWAYGSEGTALHGKIFFNVTTAGGSEQAYCREGYNRRTIRELLQPLEQTAELCGMRYLSPFVVHGTLTMLPEEVERHAQDYRRLLEALREKRIDLDAAGQVARLNADLDSLIQVAEEA